MANDRLRVAPVSVESRRLGPRRPACRLGREPGALPTGQESAPFPCERHTDGLRLIDFRELCVRVDRGVRRGPTGSKKVTLR
jgi:hypothetical protein